MMSCKCSHKRPNIALQWLLIVMVVYHLRVPRCARQLLDTPIYVVDSAPAAAPWTQGGSFAVSPDNLDVSTNTARMAKRRNGDSWEVVDHATLRVRPAEEPDSDDEDYG